MKVRLLFTCGALVLFAVVADGGSYQRTRDGQTLVWRDVPARGEEASWSGRRDKDGFATGSGVLTWYKADPTIVTGSNILDTRRYATTISHYSGRMVRGKFRGAVTYIEGIGTRSQTAPAEETNRRHRRKKAARTPAPRVRSTPRAEPTPKPISKPIIIDVPERTSPLITPTPATEETSSPSAEESETPVPPETAMATTPEVAPEQSPSPGAEESQTAVAPETAIATPAELASEQSPSPSVEESQTAASPQTDTLLAKRAATPPSEQPAAEREARNTTLPTPAQPDDPIHALSMPPSDLPKPPQSIDTETVARLDTLYHSAVKANDAAIMDEILADDFVLVTDRGASLTKADLIKEAKEKRTTYEHQEVEKGTQTVRIWRDTAVVTALLRITGTRDNSSFDYKLWLSQTYVRTPTGWRYVFGQASKPDTQ